MKQYFSQLNKFPLLALPAMLVVALQAQAGCGDSYNYNKTSDFTDNKQVDICKIGLPSEVKIVTNWGGRPVWIDNTKYAFLSNTVGHVYVIDTATNTYTPVTKHFSHYGFSRVHPLKNGDLLLVGPDSGTKLEKHNPLKAYDTGRFNGKMFILQKPYTGKPIALNNAAWEGMAVSKYTNAVSWSETNKPFSSWNVVSTVLDYILGYSNLYVGDIVYTNGVPALANKRNIFTKYPWDLRFVEPQDFRGASDESLTLSFYGPSAEGHADTWHWDRATSAFTEFPTSWGYNEWEGASPAPFQYGLIERDEYSGKKSVEGFEDLWLWDFGTSKAQQLSGFERTDYGVNIGNPTFSPDGTKVLVSVNVATAEAIKANGGKNPSAPGYSTGTAIVDFKTWLQTKNVIK